VELKQVLIVRTDLGMGKGKIAAQCAHASVEAFLQAQDKNPDFALKWLAEFQKKVVLKVDSRQKLYSIYSQAKKKFACALIKDAGHTQLKPGTTTVLGIGPAPEKDLDELTGHLKLL
jgi:PTH2 family peptidyl-tRNA hydrolase